MSKKNINPFKIRINILEQEKEELQLKYEKLENELNSWKDGTMVVKLCELEQQLAEKEKEIEEMKEGQKDICLRCGGLTHKEYEQSQNQTAIAELENAEKIIEKYVNNIDDMNDCLYAIDQQIKSLKGDNNGERR